MIRTASLAVIGGVLFAFNFVTGHEKIPASEEPQEVHMPINCRPITVWMNSAGAVHHPNDASTEITACDNGFVTIKTRFLGYAEERRFDLARGLVSKWKDEAYSKPGFPFQQVSIKPGKFTTHSLDRMDYRLAETLQAKAQQRGYHNLTRLLEGSLTPH